MKLEITSLTLSEESMNSLAAEIIRRITPEEKTLPAEAEVVIPSKLYTTKQTAEILKVGKHTLGSYAKKGLINSTMPGGKRLFKGSEIIKYLQNGEA